MKPYYDENCECYKIEDDINEEFPNSDWNMDEACTAWHKRSEKLKYNDIEFLDGSDECYACTCPTCGRIICGWCI